MEKLIVPPRRNSLLLPSAASKLVSVYYRRANSLRPYHVVVMCIVPSLRKSFRMLQMCELRSRQTSRRPTTADRTRGGRLLGRGRFFCPAEHASFLAAQRVYSYVHPDNPVPVSSPSVTVCYHAKAEHCTRRTCHDEDVCARFYTWVGWDTCG